MIETVFTLTCDDCMEPFRSEDSYEFDLALESHADVRKMANATGWKRIASKDICPECYKHVNYRPNGQKAEVA